MGCCLTSCTSNYHFMCSRAKNCVFLDDKKVYCQRHRDLIKGEVSFSCFLNSLGKEAEDINSKVVSFITPSY